MEYCDAEGTSLYQLPQVLGMPREGIHEGLEGVDIGSFYWIQDVFMVSSQQASTSGSEGHQLGFRYPFVSSVSRCP